MRIEIELFCGGKNYFKIFERYNHILGKEEKGFSFRLFGFFVLIAILYY